MWGPKILFKCPAYKKLKRIKKNNTHVILSGTPSTSLVQIPQNVPPQKNPQTQKRNSKGFSGIFGSSSTGPADRNSNKGMRNFVNAKKV